MGKVRAQRGFRVRMREKKYCENRLTAAARAKKIFPLFRSSALPLFRSSALPLFVRSALAARPRARAFLPSAVLLRCDGSTTNRLAAARGRHDSALCHEAPARCRRKPARWNESTARGRHDSARWNESTVRDGHAPARWNESTARDRHDHARWNHSTARWNDSRARRNGCNALSHCHFHICWSKRAKEQTEGE